MYILNRSNSRGKKNSVGSTSSRWIDYKQIVDSSNTLYRLDSFESEMAMAIAIALKDRQGVSRRRGAFRHIHSQLWYLHKYSLPISTGNIFLYCVV